MESIVAVVPTVLWIFVAVGILWMICMQIYDFGIKAGIKNAIQMISLAEWEGVSTTDANDVISGVRHKYQRGNEIQELLNKSADSVRN